MLKDDLEIGDQIREGKIGKEIKFEELGEYVNQLVGFTWGSPTVTAVRIVKLKKTNVCEAVFFDRLAIVHGQKKDMRIMVQKNCFYPPQIAHMFEIERE